MGPAPRDRTQRLAEGGVAADRRLHDLGSQAKRSMLNTSSLCSLLRLVDRGAAAYGGDIDMMAYMNRALRAIARGEAIPHSGRAQNDVQHIKWLTCLAAGIHALGTPFGHSIRSMTQRTPWEELAELMPADGGCPTDASVCAAAYQMIRAYEFGGLTVAYRAAALHLIESSTTPGQPFNTSLEAANSLRPLLSGGSHTRAIILGLSDTAQFDRVAKVIVDLALLPQAPPPGAMGAAAAAARGERDEE
jgi:hypothetical protein